MKVSAKINRMFDNEKKLKAFATVFFDKDFIVTGVRVVECDKGLAVFMPSRKDKNGEYKDICFPITTKMREKITNMVLNAYEQNQKIQEDCDEEG